MPGKSSFLHFYADLLRHLLIHVVSISRILQIERFPNTGRHKLCYYVGMAKSKNFEFDGGAATYVGTNILAFLVTVCTLGIAYPYALVLKQRWRAKHTYVRGFRLKFTGTGLGLFGNWIKWLFLCVITLGGYSFWVGPRITQWVVEHTDFEGKQAD